LIRGTRRTITNDLNVTLPRKGVCGRKETGERAWKAVVEDGSVSCVEREGGKGGGAVVDRWVTLDWGKKRGTTETGVKKKKNDKQLNRLLTGKDRRMEEGNPPSTGLLLGNGGAAGWDFLALPRGMAGRHKG